MLKIKLTVMVLGNVLIGCDPKRLFQDIVAPDAEIEIPIAEAGFHDLSLASDRGGSLTSDGRVKRSRPPWDRLVAGARPQVAPGPT